MLQGENQPQSAKSAGLLFLGRKRPGFDPEWGAEVKKRVRAFAEESEISWTIPADNIADETELRNAIEACRAEEAKVLVVTQPTITDGRMGPTIGQLWDGPAVLWATTEKPSGDMISANSLVGTHMIAATLRQLGRPFELVYGHPDDEETQARLMEAVSVCHAVSRLRTGRVGLIGSHAPGFIDFHADPVALSDSLGLELYHESVTEFLARLNAVPDEEVASDVEEAQKLGLPTGTIEAEDLQSVMTVQSRYHLAFRRLMEEQHLDALAFRDWPDLPSVVGYWPYLALARLVSDHRAVAMEGDVDGAICSLVAESLGAGPVYLSDWLEHTPETATIWHTGAAPFQLCEDIGSERGPRLGVQFNNRQPTVVEATIRPGMAATLFRLWRCDGIYHMTALEGVTAEPHRRYVATNGLFRTDRVDISEWFDEMVHNGMPHHVCLIPGHHRDLLRRVARTMGLAWY